MTDGPLTPILKRVIAGTGPMRLDRFMAELLLHPVHGYYRCGDRLGTDGDFTTAPEISQMFGELIGLWLAQMWDLADRPIPFRLVELGPGRGTLMRDALRAMAVMPDIKAAMDLHLVEASETFRAAQADLPATWHEALETVPEGPLFLIANEFFDALPIRQWVMTEQGWADREVTLDGMGDFCFVACPAQDPGPLADDVEPGTVMETCPAGQAIITEVARRTGAHGGAALIIDYGYKGPKAGDSLQALRRHQRVDVFDHAGEADVTAHVDFMALARAAAAHAKPWGLVPQGAFLQRLGLGVRAEMLKRRASSNQSGDIDAAMRRLTADDMMGRLFKVMAITPKGQGVPPPGFAEDGEV